MKFIVIKVQVPQGKKYLVWSPTEGKFYGQGNASEKPFDTPELAEQFAGLKRNADNSGQAEG